VLLDIQEKIKGPMMQFGGADWTCNFWHFSVIKA
jgi:hypothetical protein